MQDHTKGGILFVGIMLYCVAWFCLIIAGATGALG
jgi:hypothetical protein